jgi:hypothetical protein
MSICIRTTGGVFPAGDGVTNRQSHTVQLPANHGEVCRRALLLRILDLFRQHQNADKLRSETIVSAGLASSIQKLASLLRPMFIRPTQIKFDGRNLRGYRRQWFEKALMELGGQPAHLTSQS